MDLYRMGSLDLVRERGRPRVSRHDLGHYLRDYLLKTNGFVAQFERRNFSSPPIANITIIKFRCEAAIRSRRQYTQP